MLIPRTRLRNQTHTQPMSLLNVKIQTAKWDLWKWVALVRGYLLERRPEGVFLQIRLPADRVLVYSEPGEVPTGGLDEYLEKVGWLSEEELRSLWAERGFELLGSGDRCPANHVLPPRSELLRISRGSS